jgi:hypothetical protein
MGPVNVSSWSSMVELGGSKDYSENPSRIGPQQDLLGELFGPLSLELLLLFWC